MNILVTGGSGFVGKNLLEALPSSSKIIAISRKKRNFNNKKNIKYLKCSLKLNKSSLHTRLRVKLGLSSPLEEVCVKPKENLMSYYLTS